RVLRHLLATTIMSEHLWRTITSDHVVGIKASQHLVNVDPKADYKATVTAVQRVVDGYPGLAKNVQTYLREKVREVLTGTDDAIVLRLYGPERSTLNRMAQEVRDALGNIKGISDLRVEGQAEEAQIEIKVDIAAAERHGLKPGDIRRQVATTF